MLKDFKKFLLLMDVFDGLDGWSLPDTLQLLSLRKADREWFDIASQLKERFGCKEKEAFYSEKSCKERFDRVIGAPHPEHFLRNKGKKYSQKDLLQAWILFLERKIVEERTKRRQLLMVQFREKLVLFNKLFDDKCDFSKERIHELLEEARKEDSKHDQRIIENGIARVLPKIQELDNLHSSNPEAYGCLRLVVNVPQLCEMEESEQNLRTEQGPSPASPSLSLRSGSRSPQKGLGLQNLQKVPTQNQQKSGTIAFTKQTRSARTSPQKQVSIQQKEKSPLKSPVASPTHMANVSSLVETPAPRSGVPDSSSEVATENGCVPSSSKIEENEVCAQVKLEPEAMDVDYDASDVKEVTAIITNSVNEQVTDMLSGAAVAHSSGEKTIIETLNTMKVESPEEPPPMEVETRDDKSPGKRQLRSSRKEPGTIETPITNLRSQRNQRGLSRRASSSTAELVPEVSDGSSAVVQQCKRRTSDSNAESGSLGPSTLETCRVQDAQVPILINQINEEKLIEDAEESTSRRRSDRLRGSEVSAEQIEAKPVMTKRKALNSETLEDENLINSTKKRKRLIPENGQELIDSFGGFMPRKSFEQHEEGDKKGVRSELTSVITVKKDKKSSITDVKIPVADAVSRRSSLRSAAQIAQEGVRKDTDSDEERTLGDIRDKHRSPKKQPPDSKSGRVKEEDSLKKRSVVSDEIVSKKLLDSTHDTATVGSRKGRGSSRRSGLATPKSESQSPKKQTTEKKHSKRRDTDDGSTEKKIFLMSAWRLVSSHRHAAIFAHPVSERDAQGYSVTVKRRMDLSTLKRNVESGEVRDLAEFKRRLLLMFANAVMFNSTGHDVNIYAKEMALDTLSSLKDLEKDILYVRGGTHITRRSAAFAAEEERRKILSANSPLLIPKLAGGKETAEESGSLLGNATRLSSSRRSFSKLK